MSAQILAAAPLGVVPMASGGNNLITGYNSLMSLVPQGLLTLLAIVGVAIIIFVTIRWWWRHRHGSQGGVAKGAPVLGWVIGLTLAAPAWIIPALLTILGGLFTIVINAVTGLGSTLGG